MTEGTVIRTVPSPTLLPSTSEIEKPTTAPPGQPLMSLCPRFTVPSPSNTWVVTKPKPQKAEPHCAVVLHARPAAVQTSRLSIRWAVFLLTAEMPDDKPLETFTLAAIEQPEEYVITLHGLFFLQSDLQPGAGRKADSDGFQHDG
jgi:hypothetical protein